MKKLNIIIADDNKDIAILMKKFIENNSEYRILDIATSSKQQLELMKKYNLDIILTDIIRKGENISGLDIIIDSEKNYRKEKFILITASNKDEIIAHNKEIPRNIIGYLKKPFDWDELISTLEKAEYLYID